MQSIHIPMVAPLYAAHKPLLADRFKTKLCETFEREGYCSYDARCMFAHGSDDLRSKEMNLLDGLVTDDAIRNFAAERYGAAAATVDPNRSIVADRFKTRSCENFKRHGECSFAHRCMFAHGEEELRTTEMNIRSGLTTEEAIKTFQSECITTLRETERRRKRNLKKKTKVRAAKDARRQSDLDIAALVSDDSFVHVVADSISVDASTDEGNAATPHRPTTTIDLELTPAFLVASVGTASTDSALATPAGFRYSHDPYAAVLLGSGAQIVLVGLAALRHVDHQRRVGAPARRPHSSARAAWRALPPRPRSSRPAAAATCGVRGKSERPGNGSSPRAASVEMRSGGEAFRAAAISVPECSTYHTSVTCVGTHKIYAARSFHPYSSRNHYQPLPPRHTHVTKLPSAAPTQPRR
jgi:hypothetical protein